MLLADENTNTHRSPQHGQNQWFPLVPLHRFSLFTNSLAKLNWLGKNDLKRFTHKKTYIKHSRWRLCIPSVRKLWPVFSWWWTKQFYVEIRKTFTKYFHGVQFILQRIVEKTKHKADVRKTWQKKTQKVRAQKNVEKSYGEISFSWDALWMKWLHIPMFVYLYGIEKYSIRAEFIPNRWWSLVNISWDFEDDSIVSVQIQTTTFPKNTTFQSSPDGNMVHDIFLNRQDSTSQRGPRKSILCFFLWPEQDGTGGHKYYAIVIGWLEQKSSKIYSWWLWTTHLKKICSSQIG